MFSQHKDSAGPIGKSLKLTINVEMLGLAIITQQGQVRDHGMPQLLNNWLEKSKYEHNQK